MRSSSNSLSSRKSFLQFSHTSHILLHFSGFIWSPTLMIQAKMVLVASDRNMTRAGFSQSGHLLDPKIEKQKGRADLRGSTVSSRALLSSVVASVSGGPPHRRKMATSSTQGPSYQLNHPSRQSSSSPGTILALLVSSIHSRTSHQRAKPGSREQRRGFPQRKKEVLLPEEESRGGVGRNRKTLSPAPLSGFLPHPCWVTLDKSCPLLILFPQLHNGEFNKAQTRKPCVVPGTQEAPSFGLPFPLWAPHTQAGMPVIWNSDAP